MPIFCFKSNLVLAIDVVTGEVFARVTNCVQKRTIRLSEKLAYFMNLMEARVIFHAKMYLVKILRLGMLPLSPALFHGGLLNRKIVLNLALTTGHIMWNNFFAPIIERKENQ